MSGGRRRAGAQACALDHLIYRVSAASACSLRLSRRRHKIGRSDRHCLPRRLPCSEVPKHCSKIWVQ
jgi:hypothetical protein